MSRRKLLESMGNLYPSISQFRGLPSGWAASPATSATEPVALAGRISAVRVLGRRIMFFDLIDTSGRHFPLDSANPRAMQVRVKAAPSSEAKRDIDDNDDDRSSSSSSSSSVRFPGPAGLVEELRRGDIIGVRGTLDQDRHGRPRLTADAVELLAPCTSAGGAPPLALVDPEIRYRMRHLDLLVNEDARRAQHVRARVLRHVRRWLEQRQFVELETPVLSAQAGGAIAQPFLTQPSRRGGAYSGHGSLALRISPELYLKRAVVAGLGRVFELGKCFRDEGVDATHSPEYTMCELYAAHSDYEELMELTELMLSDLCHEMVQMAAVDAGSGSRTTNHSSPSSDPDTGHTVQTAQQQPAVWVDADGVSIDFSVPFQRVDFVEELERAGTARRGHAHPLPPDLSQDTAELANQLAQWAQAIDVRPAIPDDGDREQAANAAAWLDHLFAELVEPQLPSDPVFVCHHPAALSPLAKRHRDPEMWARGLTERFELFVRRTEWCNAYSELNDPVEQRARFEAQGGRDAKSSGAVDELFLAALEHGLPPTAGWGFGVDRAVMLFSNAKSLRDTLLFPLLKSKKN